VYGHAGSLLFDQDAGRHTRDAVHGLHQVGRHRRGQHRNLAARLGSRLGTVNARGDKVQRRKKPIGVGYAPAGDQGDRAVEHLCEARQRLHQPGRHDRRLGRRRHVEQRTVDVDEEGTFGGVCQNPLETCCPRCWNTLPCDIVHDRQMIAK